MIVTDDGDFNFDSDLDVDFGLLTDDDDSYVKKE